jgi:mono/diheme cytochrome c family protein
LYADFAVKIAVLTQAGSAQNPTGNNPRAIESGRAAYTGSCAVCHGANGDGNGAFGQSIYPPATDLRADDTRGKSDAQLFWIIKNGLSFAGMPAFGSQYSDQDIWSLVSYTRSLSNTSAAGGRTLDVPVATTDELALANPQGDAVGRGAAVYFASGCHLCHGAVGNAPGELRLRGAREAEEAIREGRRGMPRYSTSQVTDPQMSDLVAYMGTFNAAR